MFGITIFYATGLPVLNARDDSRRTRPSCSTAQVGLGITPRDTHRDIVARVQRAGSLR